LKVFPLNTILVFGIPILYEKQVISRARLSWKRSAGNKSISIMCWGTSLCDK